VSRRDPQSGEYTMERAPCYHLVADEVARAGAAPAQKLAA
jgi:adenylylsulfate reductase subunit A